MIYEQLYKPQNSYGQNVYDLMNYNGLVSSAKLVKASIEELTKTILRYKYIRCMHLCEIAERTWKMLDDECGIMRKHYPGLMYSFDDSLSVPQDVLMSYKAMFAKIMRLNKRIRMLNRMAHRYKTELNK